MKTADSPLYISIVEDFNYRIRVGQLQPGERLPSLCDIGAHYGVSSITAQRTVTELKRMGLVETIPRKGTYVAGMPRVSDAPVPRKVNRLVVLESSERVFSGRVSFTGPVLGGIREEAHEHGIHLRIELAPTSGSLERQPAVQPKPGEGFIIIGSHVGHQAMALLMSPRVPAVLVDSVAMNAPCVATDNWEGMRQVADHLAGLGHRRVALAIAFTRPVNTMNENERRDALVVLGRDRGIETTVVDSSEYADLFGLLDGPEPPTAVVFTRDTGAVRFIRQAREKGLRVPEDVSVCGFDDWEPDKEIMAELTSVHVDQEELGRRAARCLIAPPPYAEHYSMWARVAPRLVVRKSVARVPRGVAAR